MATKPFIGQMDRMIQVIELTKSRDETMAEITAESTVATPWAYMVESGGGEQQEGKVIHLIDRSYTIRFNQIVKDKSTQLMVVDSGKKYQVVHVIEIGRRSHLELRVKLYE
jgi:head-tail adaptor